MFKFFRNFLACIGFVVLLQGTSLLSISAQGADSPALVRLKAQCKAASGVEKNGRCFCPVTSFQEKRDIYIDPMMMGCSMDEICLSSYGKPTAQGCSCELESFRAGKPILITSKKLGENKCQADSDCVNLSYGLPTKNGCACMASGGKIVDPAKGEKCDLRLAVDTRACKTATPEQAALLAQAAIEGVQGLDKMLSLACKLTAAQIAPEEPTLGTIDYFARHRKLPDNWKSFFELLLQSPGMRRNIAGLDLIERWQDRKANTLTNTLDKIRPIRYHCPGGDGNLYPAYPEQDSKIYNYYTWGWYNHGKVSVIEKGGRQPYCATAQTVGKEFCLMTTPVEVIIASDTFVDSCGNLYRAFWHHEFYKETEKQPDLFSRGRSEFKDKNISFPGAYKTVTGPTHSRSVDDYFMLSEPFPGDMERSSIHRGRALNSGDFNLECGIFTPTYDY